MDWLTQIIADRWFTAFIAFFVGLLTGWLMSDRQSKVETGNGDAGEPLPDKLAALEAELKTAKALLEDKDADDEATAETLSGLDEAIKRANGRLKLIMKSIKKAKKAD